MPQWKRIGSAKHNNCTEFAFDGYEDLVFVNDLDDLLEKAKKLGWSETNNLNEANVVLYGSLNQRNEAIAYSHAIKRVGQGWEEVYGNDHNRWEDSSPPAKHSGDFIVALLKAP